MIMVKKLGIITLEEKKHYVSVSTKMDPGTNQHYSEVEFLETGEIRRFDGNLVSKQDGYYISGDIRIEEELSSTTRYAGKNQIKVVNMGEEIWGSALIETTTSLVKVLANGQYVAAGLLQGVDGEVTFNDPAAKGKGKGAIEERGVLTFKLKNKVVKATYQDEWCGCSNNKLQKYITEVNVEAIHDDEELAQALSVPLTE